MEVSCGSALPNRLPLESRFTPARLERGESHRLRYHGVRLEQIHAFVPLHAIAAHASPASISLCMTAYNEEVGAYHASFGALARNAEFFVTAGQKKLAENLTICILVDGIDTMSASFAEYAEVLGIYDPTLLVADADYHVFESSIERRLLHQRPEAHSEVNHRRELHQAFSHQRVVLLIKRKNRGKLDSHRCFFEILCRPGKPAFFMQLDVGTCPDDDAFYKMWLRLENGRNIAAVSARSDMPLPQSARDLLGAWQYCDIASERILVWPVELLMGYMSVLSGQMCLTRSEAVWARAPFTKIKAAGDVATVIETHTPDEGATSVVMKSYLRGLGPRGPFESNMFLAEDRILGLEIVFQPDSRWELSYVPEASAAIDRCETWNELLSQRRRWICSGIASRLWMFTRVPDYLRSANRTRAQKLRIITASLFHSVYFLLQWLMPAFSVILFTSLHHLAFEAVGGEAWFRGIAHAAYAVLLGLLGSQLLVSSSGRLDGRTNRFFGASIAYQTIYALAAVALIVGVDLARSEVPRSLLLLIGVMSGLLLLALWNGKEIYRAFTKSLLGYWFSRPAVAFLIMTHAALNSHNTSWGTKGLTRPRYLDDEADVNRHAGMTFRKKHFDRFRLKTVAIMLMTNVLFYGYAVSHGWTHSSVGVEIVLYLMLAQIGIAFLARVGIAAKALGSLAPRSGKEAVRK
jgi:chitin synthase